MRCRVCVTVGCPSVCLFDRHLPLAVVRVRAVDIDRKLPAPELREASCWEPRYEAQRHSVSCNLQTYSNCYLHSVPKNPDLLWNAIGEQRYDNKVHLSWQSNRIESISHLSTLCTKTREIIDSINGAFLQMTQDISDKKKKMPNDLLTFWQ